MAQNVNSTAPNLLTVASNHATVPWAMNIPAVNDIVVVDIRPVLQGDKKG